MSSVVKVCVDARPCLTTAVFDPKPYEVDFTGFLSNTVATRWMEDLRVKMMREHFSDFDVGKSENLSVIVKTEINYVHPIRYGDHIEGSVWLGKVLHCQWQVRFEFKHKTNGETLLTGLQIGAFVDSKTLIPIRVPKMIESKIVSWITAKEEK